MDKDDIPIAELEEETKNEDDENYSLNKESVGLEKRIDEEKKENEELYMYIEDSLDQGFIDQFLTNDPESFTVLEKKIKQNYYSNPVYKFLLNINHQHKILIILHLELKNKCSYLINIY